MLFQRAAVPGLDVHRGTHPAGRSQYCADCTPQFQRDRIREFRCGYPGTTFHLGADGFVDGVRPGCRLPPGAHAGDPEDA